MCERLSCDICEAHLPRPCCALAPPQPSTGCGNDCLSTKGKKKQQVRQDHASLRPLKTSRLQATSHIPLLDKWKKTTTIVGRCDCLARFPRFTKRATPDPALLPFLPLRRLAAATLRERPAPLRLDEVALPALHLELLLPPMDL